MKKEKTYIGSVSDIKKGDRLVFRCGDLEMVLVAESNAEFLEDDRRRGELHGFKLLPPTEIDLDYLGINCEDNVRFAVDK